MKFAKDVIKLMSTLPEDQRVKVEKVVRRHVAACARNGFQPENIERVYIEAVEIVRMEDTLPQDGPITDETRGWEPYRRYEQYVSPTVGL